MPLGFAIGVADVGVDGVGDANAGNEGGADPTAAGAAVHAQNATVSASVPSRMRKGWGSTARESSEMSGANCYD